MSTVSEDCKALVDSIRKAHAEREEQLTLISKWVNDGIRLNSSLEQLASKYADLLERTKAVEERAHREYPGA
ncbi:MAG TPA: hypothetical protein VGG64_13535 [Pirellulales bacterium]|jgi:hypothetical protein